MSYLYLPIILFGKKEKLAPSDAFFEFCKFIFIKIREDKKREKAEKNTKTYMMPLTLEWLDALKETNSHPVREVLFKSRHDELGNSIAKDKKKRIFEKDETLKLSAASCKELVTSFQSINLSTIDEDLNGRMFEVFLTASIRGKALGQYFTPRTVVDFMTRIALRNVDASEVTRTISWSLRYARKLHGKPFRFATFPDYNPALPLFPRKIPRVKPRSNQQQNTDDRN
jgi:type I restriction enzyme M protein